MSLETAIAELKIAVEASAAITAKNNELLIEAAAGRERAIEAAQSASAGKAKPAKAAAAETPAEKPAETPAATESPAADAATRPPLDAVSQSIVDYVDVADTAERDARKAKVSEILGKVGAKNRADIPTDKEEVFINTMKKLLEQGNLVKPAASDDLLG